jgi:hypothetical protein
LNGKVLEQELDRLLGIGLDAAYPGGGKDNDARFLILEKLIDRLLIRQVEMRPIAGHQIGKSVLLEPPDEGTPDQTSMAGYEYFVRALHK